MKFQRSIGWVLLIVLIAASCAPNVDRLAKKGDIEPLIEALNYEKDLGVRADAAAALAELGDKAAVSALQNALADDEPAVRAAVVLALAELQGVTSARKLVPMLNDPNDSVRQAAATVLTGFGGNAVDDLIEALDTSNSTYKDALVGVLAAIGAPAVDPLMAALAEENANAWQGAQEALVTLNTTAVPALIDALAETDPVLHARISDTLLAIGASTIDPLADALASATPRIAASASTLLVEMDADAVDALIAALAVEKAQPLAAESLTAIGEPAVPALVQSLGDPQRQPAAAEVLLTIGAPAVEPLISVLPDDTLGEAASEVLTSLGVTAISPLISAIQENPDITPFALSPLANSLTFQDANTRKKAADALTEIGEAAVPYILEDIRTGSRILLGDTVLYYANPAQYGTTGSAAGTLVDGGLCGEPGQWKNDIVLCQRGESYFVDKVLTVEEGQGAGVILYNNEDGGLITTLGEDNETKLVTVSLSMEEGQDLLNDHAGDAITLISSPLYPEQTNTLIEIGSEGVPHLVSALEDQLLYSPVEDILIEMGAPAVPDLIETAVNGKDILQLRSIYVLGHIEDDKAIPDLIRLLTHADDTVRQEAALALGRRHSVEAIEALGTLVVEDDEVTSFAAIYALEQIGLPSVDTLLTAYRDPDIQNRTDIANSLRDIFDANSTPVIRAASKVCDGEALPDTVKFNRYEAGPHPFVILDHSGSKHKWTNSIPVEWLPYTPEDLQAVVCLDKTDSGVVQVCPYVYANTGARSGTITRYRYQLKTALFSAATGYQISSTTLRGSLPGYCPRTTSSYNNIYGGSVGFSDLETWLKGLGIDLDK